MSPLVPQGGVSADGRPVENSPVANYDIEKSAERSGTTAGFIPITKVTSRLTRVISTLSSAEVSLPPDGGRAAWIQTAMTTLIIFNTWGYINSFGVFQTYYVTELGYSPSGVSWVGSIQIFLLFFVGIFSGRATDAGYITVVLIIGSALQVLGIFMTSCSTKFYQLLLAQGLCTGLGDGLVFCPSLALLSTYFTKRRSVALGITSLGSGLGGVIFPILVQQLLPKIGFAWTVRVLGFLVLCTSSLTIAFTKSRLPPRRTGELIAWNVFLEAPFAIFTAGMFLCFWGIYFAFYYVGLYGKEVIGVSQPDSISLLMTMNGISLVGRLVPNFFADRYFGPLNTIIPFCFVSGALIYCWPTIRTREGLFGWAAVYGLFAAGIQSLFPAVISGLTTDLKAAGMRMGMFFAVVSFACLTGPPLGGFLIEKGNGDYLYAQMWAASCLVTGGILIAVARFVRVEGKVGQRI